MPVVSITYDGTTGNKNEAVILYPGGLDQILRREGLLPALAE